MDSKEINLAGIKDSAIKVLTSPTTFFREMDKTGGFVQPLLFMVAMGIIGGLIQSIFSLIGLHTVSGLAMGVASIILLPIVIAIAGFIGAAIFFIIWKLIGSQESYETAYRCTAYVSALTPITSILGLIPYIGGLIGIVLMVYFVVIASIETHRIPSQKAWLVFGVLGAILAVITITGEITSRRMVRDLSRFEKEMKETSKELEKQLGEVPKQAEKNVEEIQKAVEEMKKQLEDLKKEQEEKTAR